MGIQFKKITNVDECTPEAEDSVSYLASVNGNLKRVPAQISKVASNKLVWDTSNPFYLEGNKCHILQLNQDGGPTIIWDSEKDEWPAPNDLISFLEGKTFIFIVNDTYFNEIKEKILQCSLDFSIFIKINILISEIEEDIQADDDKEITMTMESKSLQIGQGFLFNNYYFDSSSNNTPIGFDVVAIVCDFSGIVILKESDHNIIKELEESNKDSSFHWDDFISLL